MATNPIIRIMEPMLAIGFVVHIIWSGWITLENMRARPQKYEYGDQQLSWWAPSKNMFILGSMVLIFLVIHLSNFYVKMKFTGDPLLNSVNIGGAEMHNAYALVSNLFLNRGYDLLYIAGGILVVVESPAKAKTIEKFLGKDYLVKSSFGHIRDLDKKDFGVDLNNHYQPNYIVSEDKKKVVAELKKYAKTAKTIWIASDEDREGEAIAWHLMEVLKLDPKTTNRIVFHEITKDAIHHAIEHPRHLNKDLVDAQQARRILDRLVGFEISPVLWKKVKPSLSAGRVQSVAVRLIVEREREITNTESVPYFRVTALFIVPEKSGKETLLKAECSERFEKEEDAALFLQKCSKAEFVIGDIVTKPAKKSPAPPFTTSTLQQEASRKMGFPVSLTMSVAQRLYEAGKITYMRTDSTNLSQTALNSAKKKIAESYGEKYVKIRHYKTNAKGAQEAHEAIRPTDFFEEEIAGTAQEQKLYSLIWKRTLASQMADAELERTNVTINISNTSERFQASGEVLKFDGFLGVYLESRMK